jgi:hypothetical protein
LQRRQVPHVKGRKKELKDEKSGRGNAKDGSGLDQDSACLRHKDTAALGRGRHER